MPELNTVDILIDGTMVAESVPLEYCMVFVRSLFETYYNEPDMVITLRKHEEVQKDV